MIATESQLELEIGLEIRNATPADAQAIAEIYNFYVTDTIITFEEEIVSVDEMGSRISGIQAKGYPWIVLEFQNEIMGYAYAGQFRQRAAYRFSVEATIYLSRSSIGMGVGKVLYGRLMEMLAEREFRTVIGAISLPNDASVHLHEKLGFEKAGFFPKIGYKLDRWVDVGYWQLQLPK